MITLYDYPRSGAAWRVRLALNLLRLDWRSVPVDLAAGEQGSAANMARNPQGLVPTLEIDGMLIPQSLAIIEYLNDTHGGLLPIDAPGRARVRALSYAIAMETTAVGATKVRAYAEEISGGKVTAVEWQRHFTQRGLDAVERMLDAPQTGLFCHDDEVTMADLCLIPQLGVLPRLGLDVTSWPIIAGIAARLQKIPAVQAAHPDKVTT